MSDKDYTDGTSFENLIKRFNEQETEIKLLKQKLEKVTNRANNEERMRMHYVDMVIELKKELKRERGYLDEMVKEGVKLSYLPRFTIREKAREIISQRKIKDEDL